MRTFSDRIAGDWFTAKRLEELLVNFFEDEEIPKSILHLYAWLNKDHVEIEHRKAKNDKYRLLIETAELMCEEWVVTQGFIRDNSFSKWFLDKYHNKETQVAKDDFNINVVFK